MAQICALAHAAPPQFQTVVVAEEPQRPAIATEQSIVVRGEALRATPGTLGDPFRLIALLPGVGTPLPMLPMFVVRGASPGMSGFFIDGMRVPQLFHMLVGGGVIHPGVIDGLDFLGGAYDATYGRQNGGVASARTRAARDDRHHLEAELRLLDVSLLVELKLPKGVRVSLSGHYGYPGPILHAIDKRIDLNYWDYHLRIDWRGFTFQALGSYDTESFAFGDIAMGLQVPSMHMTFHRIQLRKRVLGPRLYAEAAVVGGFDQAGSSREKAVHKLFIGLRANLQLRVSRFTLYAGIDGELSRFRADGLELDQLIYWTRGSGPSNTYGLSLTDAPAALGDIGEERVGGTVSGALQVSASLLPRRLDVTVGARLDVYRAAGVVVVGFDPRAQLRLRMTDWLTMRVAGGVYQQPPSFPIQLPGIDTFALQLGLQRAVHGAVTESVTLPAGLSFEATGYYQRFDRVTDLPPLGVPICAPPAPDNLNGATATLMRIVDGNSSGMELLLRRDGSLISGSIAYTLSRSERSYPCGLRPSDFDQSHILNAVMQWSLPRGFRIGARLYVATGRPQTRFLLPNFEQTPRNNMRLPDYVQLDVRFEKIFRLRRGLLSLTIEVLNSTFSESALMLSYPKQEGQWPGVDVTRPEVSSFRWLLPSIGLRFTL